MFLFLSFLFFIFFLFLFHSFSSVHEHSLTLTLTPSILSLFLHSRRPKPHSSLSLAQLQPIFLPPLVADPSPKPNQARLPHHRVHGGFRVCLVGRFGSVVLVVMWICVVGLCWLCGVGFGYGNGNGNGWVGGLLIGLLWWVTDRFAVWGCWVFHGCDCDYVVVSMALVVVVVVVYYSGYIILLCCLYYFNVLNVKIKFLMFGTL